MYRHVWYQRANDLGPSFIQTFIPNRCGEADDVGEPILYCCAGQFIHHDVEEFFAFIQLDQVHLVQQDEYLGVGGVLRELFQGSHEDFYVLHDFLRLDVKDMDEYLHHLEDMVLLFGEIVLHEDVLPTTVPQVQSHITKKP